MPRAPTQKLAGFCSRCRLWIGWSAERWSVRSRDWSRDRWRGNIACDTRETKPSDAEEMRSCYLMRPLSAAAAAAATVGLSVGLTAIDFASKRYLWVRGRRTGLVMLHSCAESYRPWHCIRSSLAYKSSPSQHSAVVEAFDISRQIDDCVIISFVWNAENSGNS